MKILQINKYFYHRGGVESHFFALSKMLEKKGVEVGYFSVKDKRNFPTVFSKFFVSHVDFDKFNLNSLLNIFRIFYSFQAKRKSDKLLDYFHPEVAHLHLIYGSLSPSILNSLKEHGVPVVLTLHDWKLICPNRMLFTKGEKCYRCKNKKYFQCTKYRCVKNSFFKSLVSSFESYLHSSLKIYQKNIDCFIAPSSFVKDTFVEFGWSEDKIIVLPHFLSPEIKKIDIPVSFPQVVRFAYVGRLSKEKGIDKLVNFWLKNDISYALEIFGDGPLYKDIFEKIKKFGKYNIVLHGKVDNKEVIKRMNNITAVIMPSVVNETFGLTAIESWSQSVPVIATHSGAFVELVEKSKAGILFDWQNEDSLKKALHNIQDMKYRRQAVEYMKKNHLPEEYLGSLFSVYRKLKKK